MKNKTKLKKIFFEKITLKNLDKSKKLGGWTNFSCHTCTSCMLMSCGETCPKTFCVPTRLKAKDM